MGFETSVMGSRQLDFANSLESLRERLHQLESILDAAPIGLCLLDPFFRCITVNPRFAEMCGLVPIDFIGREITSGLPGPASQIMSLLGDALASKKLVEREVAMQSPAPASADAFQDEVIFLFTARVILNALDKVSAISVALLDITQRTKSNIALLESEEDLRFTVELTAQIPWTADAAGELLFMSPRWNSITGTKKGAVLLKDWAEVLHPADLAGTAATWSRSVRSGDPYDAEYRISTGDGAWRWVRARAYPRYSADRTILRWYGTVEDVHDRKTVALQLETANEELARRAEEDHLTGLPNRRCFDTALWSEISRARRTKLPLALLLLDVDHFKRYNDIAGHLAGDACLSQVASALRGVVRRPADLAARFGGEEFAIILPGTDRAGADLMAERALQAVRDLTMPQTDDRVRHVTISIGIAMLDHSESAGIEETVHILIGGC